MKFFMGTLLIIFTQTLGAAPYGQQYNQWALPQSQTRPADLAVSLGAEQSVFDSLQLSSGFANNLAGLLFTNV